MSEPAARPTKDLWSLVYGRPQIDPADLLVAIEHACQSTDVSDERTRMLIGDAVAALERTAAGARLVGSLSERAGNQVKSILADDLERGKFPSLAQRIMDKTRPETVLRFLRDLGEHTRRQTTIYIGGSIALMLAGALDRATDDVDLVDEIPPVFRDQHELLEDLVSDYGLRLSHFQSHYLPSGWEGRVRSLGPIRNLQVFLVDPLDIAVGKLFSRRRKDLSDVRVLLDGGHVTEGDLQSRVRESAGALWGDPAMRANAERNWRVLFGRELTT
jgi:hypothetical protein